MISRVLSVNLASSLQFSFAFFLSQLIVHPVFAAPLYKWVEEDGKIRYSDSLPPSQYRKKFQTINPDGSVISNVDAARSPRILREERAQKRRLDEKSRIKAEEEARVKSLRGHHDNVLLMTFTNENEILEAQNERLEVIDAVIKLLKKNIITEQEKLQQEEQRAKKLYVDKNLTVPGGQAQKIEYFTDKVLSKQQHLSVKIEEREKVKQQYIQDLIRYRQLIVIKNKRKKAEQAEKARLKEESFYQ